MTMVRLPPEEPLKVWGDVHKCEDYILVKMLLEEPMNQGMYKWNATS